MCDVTGVQRHIVNTGEDNASSVATVETTWTTSKKYASGVQFESEGRSGGEDVAEPPAPAECRQG
jgi:hypothetical protein